VVAATGGTGARPWPKEGIAAAIIACFLDSIVYYNLIAQIEATK